MNASDASSVNRAFGVEPPDSDTRKTSLAASAAAVIHSATWCASAAGSGSVSMRPFISLMPSPQSNEPRMKRSIALAKPSSL